MNLWNALGTFIVPILCVLLPTAHVNAAEELDLHTALSRSILGPRQTTLEVQVYSAARVRPVPTFQTSAEWMRYAAQLRKNALERIVLRGEAARWNDFKGAVEWLDTIDGPGYRVRKLRYEVIPGLWSPALLYEPLKLSGRVPVVLNVNGHEGEGTTTSYIQQRCINLAKRGLLALNVEWFGLGQLATPGFGHYAINQMDLCGTSGVAVHFLSQRRALDILLAHEHADLNRVAVTGLSGGSWQTILISSLDSRVKLANPVAGYSSFVTRAQFPDFDLGDSEQAPSDLGSLLDYTHLTAMMAPRPLLLTYNARDSCCFRADYAVSPLLSAALPVYELFGASDHLRHHINYDPGHNYGRDNREAFYSMLRDFFYGGSKDFPTGDVPSEDEVRDAQQLRVRLPEDNLDFRKIALNLSAQLPHSGPLPADSAAASAWQSAARSKLRQIVRAKDFEIRAEITGGVTLRSREGVQITRWKLSLGSDWTVPAVELAPREARSTVLLLADGGRASIVSEVERLLADGRRVIALDPFYFGESRIEGRDFLFAILLAAMGDRPLGLQASQVAAASRWLGQRNIGPITVIAHGPRTSLIATVAAALEYKAIAGIELHESLASLKEVIERNIGADEAPELFCFGLLEQFDIRQLLAMVAPRPATLVLPGQRAEAELRDLRKYYRTLGVDFDPLAPTPPEVRK